MPQDLVYSWFEPMPGSHTFSFSGFQAIFRDVVPILYEGAFRVNLCRVGT
jgi:hypothetical protein